MKLNLLTTKHIHMTGIGGIGMSALADLLMEQGIFVSGSDLVNNRLIERLQNKGCKISIGHGKVYGNPDALVRSFSIKDDNSEVIDARKRLIPIIERSELLRSMIEAKKRSVSVCGTHGKTTTTSMISYLMYKAGLDPSILIGGVVDFLGGNSRTGKSDIFVTETDESDGFISELRPGYIVATNLEKEHLEHYKTEENLLRTFREFLSEAPLHGVLIYCAHDKNLKKLSKYHPGKKISYGIGINAGLSASNLKEKGFSTDFVCSFKGKRLGRAAINVPGRHNVLNALAAIAVLMDFGVGFKEIASLLAGFRHAKRRFEVQYDDKGVMLVEDYAHHPTEIKTVIRSAGILKPRRIIAVFQPHRYSRTKYLEKEFGPAFKGVNKLILSEIYAASEKPIKGISSLNILKQVKKASVEDAVIMDKNDIPGYVSSIAMKGDIILVMGAGDINRIVPYIRERFIKFGIMPKLPKIKGLIKFNESLSKHTTFAIGGPAYIWAEPMDHGNLRKILVFANKHGIKYFIIGWGSNILASDDGYPGIAIRLSRGPFADLRSKGTSVSAGAGVMLPRLIAFCAGKCLGGAEGLVGIPGTVGGALYMNAGYKTCIGDIVKSVTVMDGEGHKKTLTRKNMRFSYRDSSLKKYVILNAVLELKKAPLKNIKHFQNAYMDIKRGTQPLGDRSAGCAFRNPNPAESAGRIIDSLGMKGYALGGAKISEKHANFIVNLGSATARDVDGLIRAVKSKVKEERGIDLKEEIIRI